MVNHHGSVSPRTSALDAEPMPDVKESLTNGDAQQPNEQPVEEAQPVAEANRHRSPSPSAAFDDLPAIFDLPSDVIYATVNELPNKDGSSLAQLPIYGPPIVTDELYKDPIEEFPIVPISKFCLERYVVPITGFEPPKKGYKSTTPEPDDVLDISKEIQVEAIPQFAPAGGVHILSPLF
jgi:hypothetical protein